MLALSSCPQPLALITKLKDGKEYALKVHTHRYGQKSDYVKMALYTNISASCMYSEGKDVPVVCVLAYALDDLGLSPSSATDFLCELGLVSVPHFPICKMGKIIFVYLTECFVNKYIKDRMVFILGSFGIQLYIN